MAEVRPTSESFYIEGYSRTLVIFKEARGCFKVHGHGLPTKGFIASEGTPYARYLVDLIEGESPDAWLVGELADHQKDGPVTALGFTVTKVTSPHGDWALTVDNNDVKPWVNCLVGGMTYSLIVRPSRD